MVLHKPFYSLPRSSPSHHLHFRQRQVVIPGQLHPHIPPAPPDSYLSQQPCRTRRVVARHPRLIDRRRQVSRTERIVRDQHVEVAQSVTATICPFRSAAHSPGRPATRVGVRNLCGSLNCRPSSRSCSHPLPGSILLRNLCSTARSPCPKPGYHLIQAQQSPATARPDIRTPSAACSAMRQRRTPPAILPQSRRSAKSPPRR